MYLSKTHAQDKGFNLTAAKTYTPSTFDPAEKTFSSPVKFTVPQTIPVLEGNSGNHDCNITYRLDGEEYIINYKGGSDQAHPNSPDQIAKGKQYIFNSCTDPSIGAGDIITCDYIKLNVLNGDSHLDETVVSLYFQPVMFESNNDTIVLNSTVQVNNMTVKNQLQIGEQSIHMHTPIINDEDAENEIYSLDDLYIQSNANNEDDDDLILVSQKEGDDEPKGNVGIGTNDPRTKLHVDGDILTEEMLYLNDEPGKVFALGHNVNGYNESNIFSENDLYFQSTSSQLPPAALFNLESREFTFYDATMEIYGNMNIYEKLNILGNASFFSNMEVSNNINFKGSLLHDGQEIGLWEKNGDNIVYTGGNVGIGTTNFDANPNSKLIVNGKITAGSLDIQRLDVNGNIINGGSDFVLGKYDGREQGSKHLNRALVHAGWGNKDELIINYDGDFEDGTRIMGPKTIFHNQVGIGTTDFDAHPNSKLIVNGKINAKTGDFENLKINGQQFTKNEKGENITQGKLLRALDDDPNDTKIRYIMEINKDKPIHSIRIKWNYKGFPDYLLLNPATYQLIVYKGEIQPENKKIIGNKNFEPLEIHDPSKEQEIQNYELDNPMYIDYIELRCDYYTNADLINISEIQPAEVQVFNSEISADFKKMFAKYGEFDTLYVKNKVGIGTDQYGHKTPRYSMHVLHQNGKIAFGDNNEFMNPQPNGAINCMLGEYLPLNSSDNPDTDILHVHGKKGIYFTGGNYTDGNDGVMGNNNGQNMILKMLPSVYGKNHIEINGYITVERVDIMDDVPQSDFVFSEDYELKPLEDIETYIKQHKHLPNIPSAKEFKENGYSIGQMDNLLLQKVEELTLHAIEQEKKIKDQDREIKNQELELKKLKENNRNLIEQNKKLEKLQEKLENIEAKLNNL